MIGKKQSFDKRNMISGYFVLTIKGFYWTPLIRNTYYCTPLNQGKPLSAMKYDIINTERCGLFKSRVNIMAP